MCLGIIYTFACVKLTIIPKASCFSCKDFSFGRGGRVESKIELKSSNYDTMLNYQKFKLLENCEFNQLTVTPSSNSLQTIGIELLEYVREKTP